ncbi:hypothetical protein AVEN_140144-1 [Araneus ventricosus]|uniref:DDE-1 domain-containing protein n=1 Tax=Araneus ventricosus TaxID=182803 RepID=A0A4Y2FUR3_ARAVE|nr:hypothetical protein AVEN_140144-1 [Araneus ventricosus]
MWIEVLTRVCWLKCRLRNLTMSQIYKVHLKNSPCVQKRPEKENFVELYPYHPLPIIVLLLESPGLKINKNGRFRKVPVIKSWKKLWTSLADSSKIEQGEANKSEFLPLIKCIPCCEYATEHTVTEWLSCDTEVNQFYTDEEIISLVQNKPQGDSDLEETDEPENVLVSHSEAANALEIALRYTEQNENATSTNIMFMRRLHNIASTRITSLRQRNMTNFFTPKDR